MTPKCVVCVLAFMMTAMLFMAALPVDGSEARPDAVEVIIEDQDLFPVAVGAGDEIHVTATFWGEKDHNIVEKILGAEYAVVEDGDDPAVSPVLTGDMISDDPVDDRRRSFYATFIPEVLSSPIAPGDYDLCVRAYFQLGGNDPEWGAFGEPMDFEMLFDDPVVTEGPDVDPNPAVLSDVTFEISATITSFDGKFVDAAEYFVDMVDFSGTGDDLTLTDGTANSSVENFAVTVDTATFLETYFPGPHTIFVHGQDSDGDWGPYSTIEVDFLDDMGPITSTIVFTPDPTNGAVDALLTARADDSTTGRSDIAAVEYFIYGSSTTTVPAASGTGVVMNPVDFAFDSANEVASATVPLTDYSLGDYKVFVHSQDAEGNWGDFVDYTFTVNDNKAPEFDGITLVANPGLGTTLDLAWDPAVDASIPITYNIYMATSSHGQSFVAPSATTQATEYTYTGLTPGLTYYFVVRAEDSQGNEDTNMVELSGMPNLDSTAPTFAGVQSVTDTEDGGELLVDWNAATDFSGPIMYNIYMATASGAQNFASPAATTYETMYTLTGLVNDVDYYVVVRAVDYPGNEDTNIVELSEAPTFLDTDAPVFSGLTAVVDSGTGDSLILNWSAAVDASLVTYNIYMVQDASATVWDFNLATPSATTSHLVYEYSSLTRGLTYCFLVRAVDIWDNMETNNVIMSAMVQIPDTTSPEFDGLKSALPLDSGTEARLSWTFATDDTPPIEYWVYYSTVSGDQDFAAPPAATTYSNSTVVGGLTVGQTYFFVVHAVDNKGNVNESLVEKSVTLFTFGLVSAENLEDGGRVELTWLDASALANPPVIYNIYYWDSSGPANYSTPKANTTDATGYIVGGLENGKNYTFAVRGIDALGNMEMNDRTDWAIPTDTTPPTLGTGSVTVSTTNNSGELYISWPAAADYSGVTYYVYASTISGGHDIINGTANVTTASTSATLTDLKDGTEYFILVVAKDDLGNNVSMAETSGTPTASAGSSSDDDDDSGLPLWCLIPIIIVAVIVLMAIVAVTFFFLAKLTSGKGGKEPTFSQPDGKSLDDFEEVDGREKEEVGENEK